MLLPEKRVALADLVQGRAKGRTAAEAAKLAGAGEMPKGANAADVAAATVAANVLLNLDAFLTRN